MQSPFSQEAIRAAAALKSMPLSIQRAIVEVLERRAQSPAQGADGFADDCDDQHSRNRFARDIDRHKARCFELAQVALGLSRDKVEQLIAAVRHEVEIQAAGRTG